jgi:tetratricopeptide (TPR) repeat protein
VTDEQAKPFLQNMQRKLTQGAASAFGLPTTASPEQVRSVFLSLTKQFHPVKFARCSSDIQRLANEVFLSIRLAQNGFPATGQAEMERAKRPLASPPNDASAQRNPARVSNRAITPVVTPVLNPSANAISAVSTAGKLSAVQRPTATPRSNLGAQVTTPTLPVTPFDEASAFVTAKGLLRQRRWHDAISEFSTLIARAPGESAYRAMIAYARGRLAQDISKYDDARLEYNRALALEPQFAAAQAAIESLPKNPK